MGQVGHDFSPTQELLILRFEKQVRKKQRDLGISEEISKD